MSDSKSAQNMNLKSTAANKSGFSSVREFANEFSRVTSYSQKLNLLKAFITDHPKVKIAALSEAVFALEDKRICIEQGSRFNPAVTFFEKIGLSGKLAGIEREISRQAKEAVKKMLSNERGGNRFPEIALGTLAPYVKKNEGAVLLRIADQMKNIRDTHPVKKVHSQFIYNCTRVILIAEKIKEQGITDSVIKTVFNENKKTLSRRSMRKVVQSYLLLDPRFKNHLKTLEETLNALLDEAGVPDEDGNIIQESNKELADLASVRDIDTFLEKSAVFIEAGGAYIDEVTKLFDLLLNAPLVNILKLLKFPLNRQMFKKWIQEAPAPNGVSDEMERTIMSVEQDLEKKGQEYEAASDPEKQLRLMYAYDIGFTDKFKLLVETANANPAKQQICQFTCKQIKDVQFKIENKFLETVISQLRRSFSFSEINIILEADENKIQARIAAFKVSFKKSIDALAAKPDGKRYSLLHSVVKHVAEEKLLSADAFVEVNKKINPDMDLAFAAKLASSLIDFYFLLNAKLILGLLKIYFSQIRKSDGVCLSHRVSIMTKEEVYGVITQYKNEPDAVKMELEKYLSWGSAEQDLRAQFVSRLGSPLFSTPEIQAGKFRLRALRYGNIFTFQIIDIENNIRFNKSITGIVTFLDFINTIQRFKIDKYVPAGNNQQKTLFQYCHIDACHNIENYIREHYELLAISDSLLQKSSQALKREINSAEIPEDKIDYFLERGEYEIRMRSALKSKCESELPAVKKESAQASRLLKEIEHEKEAVERIGIMIRFIEGLSKKKADISKLDIKEIDSYITTHRIADNNEYAADKRTKLETLLAEEDADKSSAQKVLDYLKNLPQIPGLEIEEPIITEEVTPQKVEAAINDYILFHSVEDNIAHLETTLAQCRKELNIRQEFYRNYEKEKGIAARYVKSELVYQSSAINQLAEIEQILGKELAQFQEVEKLNNDADREADKIKSFISEKEQDNTSEIAAQALAAIPDETLKCAAASKLLLTTDDEGVEEQTVRVLEKSSVDRFKILAALYKVLDAQKDYDVKIKLIDDFSAYLAENKPETFHALKSLLDIQRERLVSEYENRKMKMSDVWKMINENETHENKIACINNLLENPEMRIYWPYLEQIREGLLAENIEEFLSRNTALPVAEQLELIKKMQIYGSESYSIPAVQKMFSFKEIELSARQKIFQPHASTVFTKTTFSLLEKSREDKRGVFNAIDSELYEKEKKAVEENLREHDIDDTEIKSYLKKNLPSPEAVSRFSDRKKTAGKKIKQNIEQKKLPDINPIIKEEIAAPGKVHEQQEKAEEKKPSVSREIDTVEDTVKDSIRESSVDESSVEKKIPEEKNEKPSISFEEALMKLGTDINEDEKKIVHRIERLIQDERVDEASALIEEEAGQLAEEGRHKDMAKFLSACTWNEVISKSPKVKNIVTQTLNAGKKNIIAAASKEMVPPQKTTAAAEPHDVKELGMAGLLGALESVQKLTSLSVFGNTYGFSAEDMPRLQKILPDLGKKGAFIYLPQNEMLLGKGALSGIIHSCFNELLNTKISSVDPGILKAAWDKVRNSMPFDDQLVMLGVTSKEERSELFRELEQLLNPGGMFKKADPRKKAAAALRAQKKVNIDDTPETREGGKESAQNVRPDDRRERHTSRSGEKRKEPLFSGKKEKKRIQEPVKKKQEKYSDVAIKYISRSYAPVISAYIKRMYKQKSDFFIPFEGKKQYYTKEVLLHAIEGILRKDISGNHHLDLLDSMKRDPKLFPLILSELFEPFKVGGQTVYFPRFIKGKAKL